MRIGSLDLHEAFRTDRLIAAASFVQVWGIVEEADGALRRLTVEIGLDWQTRHIGVMWEAELRWRTRLSRG
jgi:hypothetical protein